MSIVLDGTGSITGLTATGISAVQQLPSGSVTKDMISTSTANGMGICRAWLNYDGNSATITASYNVSSVTRSSTGRYVVNFATAMPSSSYTALANACFGSGTASNIVLGSFGTTS